MSQTKQSNRTTRSTQTQNDHFPVPLRRAPPLRSFTPDNVRTDYSVEDTRFYGEGWYGQLPVPESSSNNSVEPETRAHTDQLVNSNFQAPGWRMAVEENRTCIFLLPDSTLKPPESDVSIIGDFDEYENGVCDLTVEGQRVGVDFDDEISRSEPPLVYEPGAERQTLNWTRVRLRAPQKP